MPDKYECAWSDGKKTQIAVFREDALQLIWRAFNINILNCQSFNRRDWWPL